MHVLAALDGVAGVVRRIEDLAGEPVGHAALAALAGERHQPAQRQRLAPLGADLDRDLIGRAADAAGLDFQRGHDVGDGLVEDLHGILAALRCNGFKSTVADGLRDAALAIVHDLVDQLGHDDRAVYRIRKHLALRDKSTSGHVSPS